jgi:CDP-paratose 2-epimerase
MKYLVTGGCGFVGSNLAEEILKRNEELFVFDNLYRFGATSNLEWLKEQGDFTFIHGDIRNQNDVERVIKEYKPDFIFHLSGQVAMTTSIDNPRMDFEINAMGTFNLLDAVRKYSPDSAVLYSSTNKVYGDLEWTAYKENESRFLCPEFAEGFPESIPLDFHSPYGTSKGSADQYMLDYARIYGVKTVVFRHSSMYGGRQFATYDQGWIGWFCQQALELKKTPSRKPFTISGTGKQVRDVLYASDVINLYMKTCENIEAARGNAFNIGGGMKNSLSLLELFGILNKMLNIEMEFVRLPERESDQKVFVADIKKASKLIGWKPEIIPSEGIAAMLDWLRQ